MIDFLRNAGDSKTNLGLCVCEVKHLPPCESTSARPKRLCVTRVKRLLDVNGTESVSCWGLVLSDRLPTPFVFYHIEQGVGV